MKSRIERPDMKSWFKARIDYHTRGMLATTQGRRPEGVYQIIGDVTSREIKVIMIDGSEYFWKGGEYSSRKTHGCYAPLMPKPVRA